MIVACPVTFVLGLNFLEDWLQSLIDLADQSGDMVKGADSSPWPTALVSVLTDFNAAWFPKRKVQVVGVLQGFSPPGMCFSSPLRVAFRGFAR